MAAQFDGDNLLITLDAPVAGVLNQSIEQIYDDAKQWQLNANNRKYPFPFLTSGGEPITSITIAGQYYFLLNSLGWRIQTTDEDQDVFLDGNLIPIDDTLQMVIGRPGRTVAYFGLQPLVTGVEGIVTMTPQVLKIFQLLGLEVGNKITLTPSGVDSEDGDIDIDFTGDGISTTVMDRQP
jgi:hypothetical protein